MDKPFVLPIKTPLGHYFYEVNRNEIVTISSELYNYIEAVLKAPTPSKVDASDSAKDQYNMLIECGYLSSNHIEEINHPALAKMDTFLDRGLQKLTLQVTQKCNLRCKYCIYSESSNPEQRSHSNLSMTLDMAKRAVDFYRVHSLDCDSATIGFYGGEPLLAFPLIKEIVKYAESVFEGKELSFVTTTNATLLNDEIAEFLMEKNFVITFSLDGPKAIQDRNRIFPDGKGSYDVVIRNINRMFFEYPKKMSKSGINMVVDQTQNYGDVFSLFDEPAIQQMNVSYSMVEEDSRTLAASPQYQSGQNYDLFLSLANIFRGDPNKPLNKLMAQNAVSFSGENSKVSFSQLGTVNAPSGPCIPGKLRLFVDCFGNMYPCEKVDENASMCIGTIEGGFDLTKIEELLNFNVKNAERCKKCWAFQLCGICCRTVFDSHGYSKDKHISACQSSQAAAYDQLLNKIVAYEDSRREKSLLL